jgi:hypothetical protein
MTLSPRVGLTALPDRPTVALPYGLSSKAIAAELIRDEIPGEFTGVNNPSGVSVLRHLVRVPKHRRVRRKPSRKPFEKMFRNFKP